MAKIQKKLDRLPSRDYDEDTSIRRKPSALFDNDEEYQSFSKQLDALLGVPDYDDDEDDEE